MHHPGPGFWSAVPRPRFVGGDGEVSQGSWGTPRCTCPGLGSRRTLASCHFRTLRCCLPRQGLRRLRNFGAFGIESHSLCTSCVRFAAMGRPMSTQHSVPVSGQLFPGRIDYLLGSNAGFKHLHGAILLAQAYPGATPPRQRAAWLGALPQPRGPRGVGGADTMYLAQHNASPQWERADWPNLFHPLDASMVAYE
jgi:hypothetical protein